MVEEALKTQYEKSLNCRNMHGLEKYFTECTDMQMKMGQVKRPNALLPPVLDSQVMYLWRENRAWSLLNHQLKNTVCATIVLYSL